jgi:hypothetical protein
MLYFADPVLASRAQLAPPTEFWSIEDGAVVKQPSIKRTRHAISKAEILAPEPETTGGEPISNDEQPSPRMQGFLEEITTGANTPCK